MAKHKGPIRDRPGPRQNQGGRKIVKSGTIELPAGAIPSPSGGKSSAFDFSQALLQGNPTATAAYDQAMGGTVLRGDPDYVKYDKPEDEASVADKFVASTYDWCRHFNYTAKQEKQVMPILMAYRHAMRNANKFVLDNEFVEYATNLSNNVTPPKLLTRLPLATLPYETTWIEFDLHVKVRTMRRFHRLSDMPEGGVAKRMGVLLERVSDTVSTVTMVCEQTKIVAPNLTGYVFSTDERTLSGQQVLHGMTPFDAAYRVDRLKRMPLFNDVMKDPEAESIMRRIAHGTLWGFGDTDGVLKTPRDVINHIQLPEYLALHGQLAFSRFYDFIEDAGNTKLKLMEGISRLITSEVTEFAGMMRWLVIVLAMLNEVPTRASFIQPMHQMRHGLTRRVAAFEFHRLTLRLPKTKPIPFLERHISNVERHHKAHKVRQHWRTYLPDVPCMPDEHDWNYDEEHGYALCGKCMAFRRRIHEHVRGDPSLGWVNKEYLIKPEKQE